MVFVQFVSVIALAAVLGECFEATAPGIALPGALQYRALQADVPIEPGGTAAQRQMAHMRREVLDPAANIQALEVGGPKALQQGAAELVSVSHSQVPETAEDTTTPESERPQSISAEEAGDKLEEHGLVEVYRPAPDASVITRLEEESLECMMDTPVWQCMEKFGSYGIRRLFTDTTDDFEKLHFWKKDWMSNGDVQKRKLYDVVWPGTHDSGAYGFDPAVAGNNDSITSVRGALTQSVDTFTQLKMGVRAFDIQVATGVENGQLYTANGFLTTPLSTFLTDIASFLEQHKHEVILLFARKADVWNGITNSHVRPLRDEEADPTKVPGESVHKGVDAVIGNHLATHEALKRLQGQEGDPANPKIEACIAASIRVFYFWEGQQVLCVDHAACSKTPGWQRGNLGSPWAFGPPMAMGARQNLATGMNSNDLYLEPACVMESTFSSGSGNPFQLLMNSKSFSLALMDHAKRFRPKCFASDGAIPDLHKPPLLYKADMFVTPHTDSEGKYKSMYLGIKEIFTKGEPMTLQSEAERTNYLLLMWLLRRNWRPLYTKLNVISTDYVAPAVVQRIIEANQNTPECGFAVHCKPTGSCWAMTRLDPDDGQTCLDEDDVRAFLKWHADGSPFPWWAILIIVVGGSCCLKLICCSLGCFICGNKPYPVFSRKDGFAVVWFKRQPKPKVEETEEQGEVEGEGAADDDNETAELRDNADF